MRRLVREQRGRGAAKPPLAEFGEDPVSGKKVTVKEGRFGPYVTDGVTNITVPRGRQPEELTAEEAYLQAARDQVLSDWGGAEAWVRDGLGIDRDLLQSAQVQALE